MVMTWGGKLVARLVHDGRVLRDALAAEVTAYAEAQANGGNLGPIVDEAGHTVVIDRLTPRDVALAPKEQTSVSTGTSWGTSSTGASTTSTTAVEP
jgi:hypothetical protein